MKKLTIYLIVLCWGFYLTAPTLVHALEDPALTEPPTYSSPVIITEIQTGAGAASDEFVELYNTSDQPIDITGWQVRYINATSTGDTTLLAAITADTGAVFIPAHGFYAMHTATVALPQGILGQVYSAKLSSADKAVGLFAPDIQTCLLEVVDAIGWGTSAAGEGLPATNPTASGERLIQRYVDSQGYYEDTSNNQYDTRVSAVTKSTVTPVIAVGASPGANNALVVPVGGTPGQLGQGSAMNPVSMTDCIPPEDQPGGVIEPPTEQPPATVEPATEDDDSPEETTGPVMPARDIGLKSPQITELLPNPAKPLTDAADEFIELYNSNDEPFELTGFMLEAGTAKKHYIFPQGTMLEPRSFRAFFSVDTHLGLSNTQGQVSLLDPFGNVLNATDTYGAAKDNQAWCLANGTWYWSTSPTPNAANVIKIPVAKAKTVAKTAAPKGVTAVKGASGATSVASQTVADEEQRTPIHTGVLALVGLFAILYGAYEYRSDLANKIYQLRLYRTTRREARQSAKGR